MPLLISTKDVGLSPELRNKLTALGISANSFDELVELFVEAITKPTETQTVSASSLPSEARTFGLGGGSSQAVKLLERNFSWSANDATLTYDISNIKKALPTGITYGTTNVVITGKGRAASRASAGSLTLPTEASQASVNITLLTEFGDLALKKTFPIEKNGSGTVQLEVDDTSAAPTNMSVSEHLELLSSKIATLEQR